MMESIKKVIGRRNVTGARWKVTRRGLGDEKLKEGDWEMESERRGMGRWKVKGGGIGR